MHFQIHIHIIILLRKLKLKEKVLKKYPLIYDKNDIFIKIVI